MACFDPTTGLVHEEPGDDASYAPTDPLPICEPSYPIEAVGAGDASLPFVGMYGDYREELGWRTDLTMTYLRDETDVLRRERVVEGGDDLAGIVDLALDAAGPDCIDRLRIDDGGSPGYVEFGGEQLDAAHVNDFRTRVSLARLADGMCADGEIEMEIGEAAGGLKGLALFHELAKATGHPVSGALMPQNEYITGHHGPVLRCVPEGCEVIDDPRYPPPICE